MSDGYNLQKTAFSPLYVANDPLKGFNSYFIVFKEDHAIELLNDPLRGLIF
jgi:hypothetical protein